MTGLDPVIHVRLHYLPVNSAPFYAQGLESCKWQEVGFIFVTNRPNGTLYVGVTSNIARRAWEHREGAVDGFTKKYGLKCLVYSERHDDIRAAFQREQNLKHWSRAWKVRLILDQNPSWKDLYDQLN